MTALLQYILAEILEELLCYFATPFSGELGELAYLDLTTSLKSFGIM